MILTHQVFLSAFLAAAAALPAKASDTDQVPYILRDQGVTQENYRALRGENLISPILQAGGPECLQSDELTFKDKAILAENVVQGRVAKVTYLYAQGGPYRALYDIEVEEVLKGASVRTVQVLSPFGPTRRDHRRWKHNPFRIVLQKGDEGVFYLTGKPMRDRMDMVPVEVREFLTGKYLFLNGMQGVYLYSGGEVDPVYLEKSRKRERRLSSIKLKAGVERVAALMPKGNSK